MNCQIDSQILRQIPIFKGITSEDIEFLAKHLRKRLFKNGDVVMREGEAANSLFVVLSGSLSVQKDGITICLRGPQAVIGEQALIDEPLRSATLTAIGWVELLQMNRETFDKMIHCSPQFSLNMLTILSGKLRQATNERGLHYGREERLQNMFGQHLSQRQLEELLLSPDLETFLAPRRVEATVLYSDIRGFTTASENLDPNDLANQLNAYFNDVIHCVYKYDGLIDKFIGDAILVVFGIPDQKEDDPERAIRCALEIEEIARRHTIGGQPVRIGIGIHTGTVFYGHLGNEKKRQLTILGDVVNTAARLEAKTKEYKEDNISILISGSIVEKLQDIFPFQSVGQTVLNGRSTATTIYTIRQGVCDGL